MICDVLGLTYSPEGDVVVSHETSDGELMGGAVFRDYTGRSIFAHMAGFKPNWLSREFLKLCFNYTFNELGAETVFGPVPSENARALEVNRKIGFKEIVRVPGVYRDGDMVLMAMKRDECRWLNLWTHREELDGKEERRAQNP